MPYAIVDHPRIASIHDAFEGQRDDLLAYAAVVDELNARVVLDVGCGTGTLAELLARERRTVVAIDPSEAFLAVAKAKGAPSGVTWLHGDAANAPEVGADLAVLTANVVEVFLTDEDWAAALTGIRRALRPGGFLVSGIRHLDRRVWVDRAADIVPAALDVPGIGRVQDRLEVTAVNLPLVSFRDTYTFAADGAAVAWEYTLRFRERPEIESDLTDHGFRLQDFRDVPGHPGCEVIFIAERVD
ncbi:class I SAM-dependent methyltransferase [Nocardia arthritidis]|uniref:class I SAM-dependent methyltransferase n=1 Tax=Nocardia arthritidis TaxID=228602 RepID=UPI00142D9F32|nr:class I SAM-dependent methyltransferase [Nocardia arthritidis]